MSSQLESRIQSLIPKLAAATGNTVQDELERVEVLCLLHDSTPLEEVARCLNWVRFNREEVHEVVLPLALPTNPIACATISPSLCSWSNEDFKARIQHELASSSACHRVDWDWFTLADNWESIQSHVRDLLLEHPGGYFGVTSGIMWRFHNCRSASMRPHCDRFSTMIPVCCGPAEKMGTMEKLCIRLAAQNRVRIENQASGGDHIGSKYCAFIYYCHHELSGGE